MTNRRLKAMSGKIWAGKKRQKQNRVPAKQPPQIILESSNETMNNGWNLEVRNEVMIERTGK